MCKKLLFLLVLISAVTVNAQWVQANGPYGGVINCIAGNGRELFAGTNGGLYRSTNNGNNWQRFYIEGTNYDTQILNIYDIYVRDSTIMISTNNLFWVSTDDGLNWHSLPQLASGKVQKFFINGYYLAYVENPNESNGTALLYVTKLDSMMLRLSNPSFGFLNINPPLTPSAPEIEINSIIFNINYIVVGTTYGMYISSDTGKTWAKSDFNLTDTTIEAVAMCGTKIFAGSESAGIFCSIDSGRTWSRCDSGLTTLSIRALSVNGDKIYAGTNGGGVFISTDFGASWNPINQGITNQVINTICFNNDVPIAGTNGSGVFVYNGGSWAPINYGLSAAQINTFADIGSCLFAGSDGGGVYLSTDDGTNWIAVNSGLTSLNINAIATKGSDLFAGTLKGGVFHSNDNGTSWKAVNNGIIAKHINALTVSGNNIFAGTFDWSEIPITISLYNYSAWTDSGLIYRSSDNGNSWVVVDTALFYVYSLASIDSNIFASSIGGGIKHSTDLGNNWQNINKYYGQPQSNVIMPVLAAKGEKLFAGTNGFGIDMYNVQDTSWGAISNSGLMYFLGVQSLLSGTITSAITSNDSILFAAFKGYEGSFEGLYLSYDEGNNWKGINTPFINGIEGLMLQPIITSLWIYDNYLFAGTNSFGIWKVSLSDIVTGIGKKTNEIPSEFILNQNYPNPFNPTTVIEYQLPKSGFVTLKVYDILGREVRTLVNGYKTPGKYSVSFDASNLSSGAYFYRLKSNSFSSIKKMLLIR